MTTTTSLLFEFLLTLPRPPPPACNFIPRRAVVNRAQSTAGDKGIKFSRGMMVVLALRQ